MKWEEYEIDIIKKYAGILSSTKIAELCQKGRTYAQVKCKAARLEISLRTYGENCSWSKYSNHDCELARQLHEGGMLLITIGEKMEIPYHALHSILYFKRS